MLHALKLYHILKSMKTTHISKNLHSFQIASIRTYVDLTNSIYT